MRTASTTRSRKARASLSMTALARQKPNIIARLRRVEGQLRGVQGMIENNAECEAVAQQVAAARRALDRAFYEIVACSMESEIESAPNLDQAKSAAVRVARILGKYG